MSIWAHPHVDGRIAEEFRKLGMRFHLFGRDQDSICDISSLVRRVRMTDQGFSANTS